MNCASSHAYVSKNFMEEYKKKKEKAKNKKKGAALTEQVKEIEHLENVQEVERQPRRF